MGKIHDRFKTGQARLHTISVDARIAPAAAASGKSDTARRMSVFMQDLDRVRTDRTLGAATRHATMQRLADEAKELGLKGRWNLLCNRTQCLRTPATWYNRGSHAFYCEDCAHELNHDSFNARDAERLFGKGEKLCRHIATQAEADNPHVWSR